MLAIRLLFDLTAVQPIGSSPYHGGSEYAKAVYERLVEKRAGRTIVGVYDPSRPLDVETVNLSQRAGITLLPVRSSRDVEVVLRRERISRFYSALPYRYYNVRFGNTELVYTIHGLRPIELPADRYALKYSLGSRQWLRQMSKAAVVKFLPRLYLQSHLRRFARLLKACVQRGKVVVPSRHTKYVLLSYFPWLPPDNVLVLWSPRKRSGDGMPASHEDRLPVLNKYGVAYRRFFLVLSANRWEKNAYRAVHALDSLYTDWPSIEHRTVVLGAREGVAAIWRVKNVDRFTWGGYVPPRELEILYQSAYALIYPSLNEGFGYPPLECMKYGTPVIASGTSAVPEICGDAALYVNPTSIVEIKSRALALLHEPDVWQQYSSVGKRRAQFVAMEQDRMLEELCDMLLAP